MSRYWEAFGEVKEKLLAMQAQREAARKEMFAFANRHGTNKIAVSESISTGFYLSFDAPPDPKLWKKVKDSSTYYLPKESSKDGKAMAKEMAEISRKSPAGSTINEIIGMEMFTRGMWHTAGCAVVGDRVLVVTATHYSPPAELAEQVKRIADTEFEALTGKETEAEDDE
jgi:hypothetical protein